MRYAALERQGKECREVILILPNAEMQTLAEMAAAAVKTNGRKGTWKKMLAALEEVPAW